MTRSVKAALAAVRLTLLVGVGGCGGACDGAGTPQRSEADTTSTTGAAVDRGDRPPERLEGVRVHLEEAPGSAPRGALVTRVEVRGPDPVRLAPGFTLAVGDPAAGPAGPRPPLRYACVAPTSGCLELVPGAELISPPWVPEAGGGVAQCGAPTDARLEAGARAVVRSCDGAGWAASPPVPSPERPAPTG